MSTEKDTPLRVAGITRDRVRYVAHCLGKTQAEIVEIGITKVIRDIQPDLDDLTEAFLGPKTTIERVEEIRARALGKLALPEEASSQDARVD